MALPLLAIIGRPNVGKSTLVNRLAGERIAIVHDEAGVTRDRLYREADWCGRVFRVVDTGGILFDTEEAFLPMIRQQALAALAEAQVALLVVDGMVGLTPADQELADWLRLHAQIPVLVGVNKCESAQMGLAQAASFWELGLGEPLPFSAIHGNGVAEILDLVLPHFPEVIPDEGTEEIAIAIVGRPNVGKSSLLNFLVGSERAIVSPVAGTTRDAIDTVVIWQDQSFRLIDTAGIRRKNRIDYGVEFFSINRAFKAIERADVVLLVVDATESISEQDQRLAGRITDAGKACLIVVNKWDLVEKDSYTIYDHTRLVRDRLSFLEWAPVLFVSAKTGQRVTQILSQVQTIVSAHRRRVTTAVINEVLQEATSWMTPPTNRQGKQGRIYYGTQVSTQPPAIALFVNDPALFRENYRRYLEKQFRTQLDFTGTPLRFLWRGKTEREASRTLRKSARDPD